MSKKKPYYRRNLIRRNETKITYFQILGGVLIIIGLGSFLIAGLIMGMLDSTALSAGSVAICFFLVMFGMALAFPEMLEDYNNGLSTMRIAVFMVVNVFCLLVLKMGWAAGSFTEIGLDEYWLGLLALVFGAKTAQSYFESRSSRGKTNTSGAPQTSNNPVTYTSADLVNMAIAQHQNFLYSKGNIRLLVQGKKHDAKGNLIDCLTIHLKDDKTEGIPDKLIVQIPGMPDQIVETEVIEAVEKPVVSYDAGDSIANGQYAKYKGSIACKLKLPNGTACLLTCSHVMTGGSPIDHRGYFSDTDDAQINGTADGKWFYGLRDAEFDIALIKEFTQTTFSFLNGVVITSARDTTPDDIKQTKVTMIGRKDFYGADNAKSGYIINHRAINPITITYNNNNHYEDVSMYNLILIASGTTSPYGNISRQGDSGSMIYDDQMRAIGIVLGQNSKFTYAIAFPKILKKLSAEII